MKLLILMSLVCLLSGGLHAQNEGAQEVNVKKVSLVDLIVERDVVYSLDEIGKEYTLMNKWEVLAGNRDIKPNYFYSLSARLGLKRIEELKKYYNEANQTKKFSSGELFLFFKSARLREEAYFILSDYTAEFYNPFLYEPLPDHTIKFPKYDGLRDDLIWLCRNRYLLKLLKKGELTVNTYHFSPHEMQFLVLVCSEEYLKGLHKYAESDVHEEKLKELYQFMDFSPAKMKEFPVLNEVVVEKLANALDDKINDKLMFADATEALVQVTKKIKEGKYVTQRDKRLIRSFFTKNDDYHSAQNELALVMKDKILAKNDIQLLKAYLERLERRQSIADILVLAEFVQSKAFLEGSVKFQEPIMRQFSLRKENEVVWILAPLLKHKDPELAERARIIMGGITHRSLGEDPADWRAWYTAQHK